MWMFHFMVVVKLWLKGWSWASFVLESYEALVRFADSRQLMSNRQHGFLHGRSCLTNLLNASEQWSRGLDKRAGVDVIYFDFKKPFDCVPQLRILHKWNELGMCGRLHSSIQSFLYQKNAPSQSWRGVLSVHGTRPITFSINWTENLLGV